MKTDKIVTNLNKITELSTSMLESARSKEWEQLEQQKRELVKQTFPLGVVTKDTAAIIGYIQKITGLDKETMELVAKGRKEVAELVDNITTGRQAVTAYQNIEK